MKEQFVRERIVDDLYWLGYNTILRFSVRLGSRDDKGNRKSYFQEFPYESNRYKDYKKLSTIKRQYEYFISLENIKEINGEKEFIIIGVQDYPYFSSCIKQAASWLNNSDLYRLKDNDIIMVGTVDPIVINLMAWNKTITLEPISMKNEYNVNCSGIRMTLGNRRDNFVDIPIDRFMGFAYIIETFNMPMAAMMVLSSLGSPEQSDCINPNNSYEVPKTVKPNGTPGRFIGNHNDLERRIE